MRRAWTAAASVMPRNSPMSAPAMKPFGLAERSTRPFGMSRSRVASTSLSSASTSSESVLALAFALSSASQAMPSSSRASIKLRQGEPARSWPASGPSSRLRGARTSQTLPIYGIFICAECIIAPRTRCAPLPPLAGGGIGRGHAIRSKRFAKRFICARSPPPHPPPQAGEGADRVWRSGGDPKRGLRFYSRHRLDQHGAALAAADAFGGDALLDAAALHGVDEMQHDAVAARAHGMAQPDGAAVDVELVALDAAGRAIKAEHLAAERVVLPGGETGEHLRGEGFVELPQADVAERKRVPAQERGRAQHGPEPHDRGIERRPLAVDDHRARGEPVFLHRGFGGEDHPRGAVGDLGRVARGHLAPRPLERGLELGQRLHRAVWPHAVVVVVEPAVAAERYFELAGDHAVLLRAREALLALGRVRIGVVA